MRTRGSQLEQGTWEGFLNKDGHNTLKRKRHLPLFDLAFISYHIMGQALLCVTCSNSHPMR